MPDAELRQAIPGILVALPLQTAPADEDRGPGRFPLFAWTRWFGPRGNAECECSVVASYQTSCFAQQMAVGGFDIGTAERCSCARVLGRTACRLR